MKKRLLQVEETPWEVETNPPALLHHLEGEDGDDQELVDIDFFLEEIILIPESQHSTYIVASDFRWDIEDQYGNQKFWEGTGGDEEYHDIYDLAKKRRADAMSRTDDSFRSRLRGSSTLSVVPSYVHGRTFELPSFAGAGGSGEMLNLEVLADKKPRFALSSSAQQENNKSEADRLKEHERKLRKLARLSETKEERKARKKAEYAKKREREKRWAEKEKQHKRRKKKLEALTTTVRNSLHSFYKDSKFKSKDSFKHLVRELSKNLQQQYEQSNDGKLPWNPKVKEKTERFVTNYMKKQVHKHQDGWQYSKTYEQPTGDAVSSHKPKKKRRKKKKIRGPKTPPGSPPPK